MDIGVNGSWQGRIRRRSEKQAERFRRRYQREHRLYHAIREDAADICSHLISVRPGSMFSMEL